MTDELRDHLLRDHGRWCGELVGVDDATLDALHELDHYDESVGLHPAYHAA